MKQNNLSKLFDIKGQTIVLTGSSGILGTEFSHFLSDQGANVVLIDIEKAKNKKLEQILQKSYSTKPTSFSVDITNQSEVQSVVKSIFQKYKKIDALINNAAFHPKIKGGNISKPLTSFPLELWKQAIDVNLTGTFLICQEIGKVMEKRKKGIIVNISSIYGIVGADQRIYGKSNLNSPVSYAATKGGIVNLTRYLAAYWQRKNIRVNTLTLGGVQIDNYMNSQFIKNYSKKTILGRMANKDDYNGSLLFLLSNASSYMTGSNLIIDGGWTAW